MLHTFSRTMATTGLFGQTAAERCLLGQQESPAIADKPARRLKFGPRVTQGHRKWHHSIACIWFPIKVLQ